jgi:hypothetical protein
VAQQQLEVTEQVKAESSSLTRQMATTRRCLGDLLETLRELSIEAGNMRNDAEVLRKDCGSGQMRPLSDALIKRQEPARTTLLVDPTEELLATSAYRFHMSSVS